ncbi:MAG: hypothetical protein NC124_20710, partial [Clostridium sp.]|nr:hypothetical protein [Clostridium sp.]
MDQYIVVGNDGWYAGKILKEFPNYQGIDRFPWPIMKEDLKRIQDLPNAEKTCAQHYMEAMGDVNITAMYCDAFTYAYQYQKLCDILKINVDIYLSRLYDGTISENQLLAVDSKEWLFVGYDYVL